MIYLDNAATTGKKPETVIDAVEGALRNYSVNPGRGGYIKSVRCAEAVYNTRKKAAEFFGASSAERVIFTSSCTHSINTVLKGVLKKGDHIIVSSLEHNAVMRPLIKLGADVSIAGVSLDDDRVTVENFQNLLRDDTKMIFVTAASNVCGKCLPLFELGKLCRQNGILFGVDAAQGAGVMPVNMKKHNIDFLCVAPHKGLYAPMGVGILIAEKDIENTLIEGGTGTNSMSYFQPMEYPERLESGTLNVPAIMGISAGIDFVKGLGRGKIEKSEMKLISRLYDALQRDEKVVLYTHFPKIGEYVPVLSFNLKNYLSGETSAILEKGGFAVRAGLHCAPLAHKFLKTENIGTVRVAPSVFNKSSDIERLVNFIKHL